MSIINKTKFGDCSTCPSTNTSVVKVGKNLFCLNCHRTAKNKIQIQKANERNQVRRLINKSDGLTKQVVENKSELDAWFNDRRKEMTGKCELCGGKTEKYNDKTYKRSIHHLFDKRKNMFPSVSTHPDNWIEVCFYGNSCHTNIHNGKITWQLLLDSAEREMILSKVLKIYPFIAESERKNIQDCLYKGIYEKSFGYNFLIKINK